MSYEVWGEPEEWHLYTEGEMAELCKERDALIADLAMMIRRLDMALGHSNSRHPLREQAKGLLLRNNLNGSILRDEYTEGTQT